MKFTIIIVLLFNVLGYSQGDDHNKLYSKIDSSEIVFLIEGDQLIDSLFLSLSNIELERMGLKSNDVNLITGLGKDSSILFKKSNKEFEVKIPISEIKLAHNLGFFNENKELIKKIKLLIFKSKLTIEVENVQDYLIYSMNKQDSELVVLRQLDLPDKFRKILFGQKSYILTAHSW